MHNPEQGGTKEDSTGSCSQGVGCYLTVRFPGSTANPAKVAGRRSDGVPSRPAAHELQLELLPINSTGHEPFHRAHVPKYRVCTVGIREGVGLCFLGTPERCLLCQTCLLPRDLLVPALLIAMLPPPPAFPSLTTTQNNAALSIS